VSRRTAMEPCWTCGSANVTMVLLDESHWLGTCLDCGEESSIHWSKPLARKLWNGDAKARRAKQLLVAAPRGTPEDRLALIWRGVSTGEEGT